MSVFTYFGFRLILLLLPKIFLAGPIDGHDAELVSYRFAAAKQRLQSAFPQARIFNTAEDLDTDTMREAALASGFDPSVPADRLRLLFSEFVVCTEVCFLPGWQEDDFCQRVYAFANEFGGKVYELDSPPQVQLATI